MTAGLDALYAKGDPKGDPEAAAPIFRKVLEQNPSHYGATFQLAMALDRAGKGAEARPLWEKVLRGAPPPGALQPLQPRPGAAAGRAARDPGGSGAEDPPRPRDLAPPPGPGVARREDRDPAPHRRRQPPGPARERRTAGALRSARLRAPAPDSRRDGARGGPGRAIPLKATDDDRSGPGGPATRSGRQPQRYYRMPVGKPML